MMHFFNLFFFLLLAAIIYGQPPMEKYALGLQKRIIALEKKSEARQMQLRYYQTLPAKIKQAKERIEELNNERGKNVEERKILSDSLNAVKLRKAIMENELIRVNQLLKIATDSLNTALRQLGKAKISIDSLIKLNGKLQILLDNALLELSEIKEIVFGVLQSNGTFTYRVKEDGLKTIFTCPKEFGLGSCNLTHVGFKLSIYSREDLSSHQYVLVVYQKDSYGNFLYHTHVQFGFNRQPSIYEGYHKYNSNLMGEVKLKNDLPSNRDYVVGIMEFRGKSPDLSQISLPFGRARENNLLIRTREFTRKP